MQHFGKAHVKTHTEARYRIAVLAFVLISGAARESQAIVILPNFFGGTPSQATIGGGDLETVFRAAAKLWEEAFPEDHTLSLDFGWGFLGPGIVGGEHSLISQGGIPNRETHGQITFNNGGDPATSKVRIFLDPTPYLNEEFTTYSEFSWDFGTGPLNTGRLYEGFDGPFPCCDIVWIDVFSVALHEIGHALGLSLANANFQSDARDGDLDITVPALPFTGFSVPLARNFAGYTSHFDTPITNVAYLIAVNNSVMAGGPGGFSRELPSALDVLALAQLSGFTEVNLRPEATVPEPTSLVVMGMGWFGLLLWTAFRTFRR